MACTYTLPAVAFDDTCQTIKKGQVYKLAMTRPTADDVMTDFEDPDEWDGRLHQSTAPGVGAAKIRMLSGIGSWGAGEVTDIPIPLDQVFSVTGNKVLTFKVYDMTAENMAAIITLRDAGTTQQKIWTVHDDVILGGDAGINGAMRADLVVPEGRTDLTYGEIVFTTKNSINAAGTSPFTVL